MNTSENEVTDDNLSDLNDSLSTETFRIRKKSSNPIKTDPESFIDCQSQKSWEESAANFNLSDNIYTW
jgi:hypothetical protein